MLSSHQTGFTVANLYMQLEVGRHFGKVPQQRQIHEEWEHWWLSVGFQEPKIWNNIKPEDWLLLYVSGRKRSGIKYRIIFDIQRLVVYTVGSLKMFCFRFSRPYVLNGPIPFQKHTHANILNLSMNSKCMLIYEIVKLLPEVHWRSDEPGVGSN